MSDSVEQTVLVECKCGWSARCDTAPKAKDRERYHRIMCHNAVALTIGWNH